MSDRQSFSYQVAGHLHVCIVGETPVFLDETMGRYFLLRGPSADALCAYLAGQAWDDARAILVAAGLIASAGDFRIRRMAVPVFDDECQPDAERLPFARVVQAAALQIWSRRFVRRHTFLETMALLRSRSAGLIAARGLSTSVEAVAAAFAKTRAFVPTHDLCLPRSLAIARALQRAGHRPTVIIGVQLPVAAHCWVQCEGRIVADSAEHVAAFHPIVAI